MQLYLSNSLVQRPWSDLWLFSHTSAYLSKQREFYLEDTSKMKITSYLYYFNPVSSNSHSPCFPSESPIICWQRSTQNNLFNTRFCHSSATLQWLLICGGCSVTQSCLSLWDPMDCSQAGFPVLHYILEFAQTHIYWVSDDIQPSNPLYPLLLLPSIFLRLRVTSNESVLHIRWPKDWNFSFSISPSNEYSGLISFRIDWFDLLVVSGTLKSLLQHQYLKHHFITQPSSWYNSHILTGLWKSHSFDYLDFCWQSNVSAF